MAMMNSGNKTTLSTFACYNVTWGVSNNIWKSDDVLHKRVPLLCFQVAYDILASRLCYQLLRPIRVPLFVAQILAGFLLSPFAFGAIPGVFESLYRQEGVLTVETLANLGVVYYVFLSGLEMNSDTILKSKKKGTSIAVASIVAPILIGVAFLKLLHQMETNSGPDTPLGSRFNLVERNLFWCLPLAVTGFPVLARILAKLKLLYTRLGKDALTAAMLIDAYCWVLFTLLIPFSNKGGKPITSALSTLAFIVFCFCVLRPTLTPIIQRKTAKDTWCKSHLLDVLVGMFVCAYVTEFLGTHAIVGAFVYGLILPHGKFADMVLDISDDFVTGILCPVYFAGFGLRVNITLLSHQEKWPLMLLIVLLLATPKVLSSLIVTFFFGMPARDGLAIGLLLNTKGVMTLVLLSVAWDKGILEPLESMIMTLGIILMTVIVPPLTNAIFKPKFRYMQSQLRTVEKLRFDAELRVVVCIHKARHAAGMIRVLEATNATRISPIHVSALHLVELTRHGTAILVSQMEHSSTIGVGEETTGEYELIKDAFEDFVEQNNAVRFEQSSAVSSYTTIHEDIYNVAEEKRASLILLPFHKELTSEGALEMIITNEYCDINKKVLQHAPCSVGIFMDRGLGPLLQTKMSIVMIFIGGPDDREALSIAWRMAGHQGTQLHVVRIHLVGEAAEEREDNANDQEFQGMFATVIDSGKQKELDEEYIFNFRHKAVNNNDSIVYSEREVQSHTGEEIPTILNEIDKDGYDLYIVGQGSGKNSLVFERLLEWCDNPELGVIGDIVASTSFGTDSSVLIVQQYLCGRKLITKSKSLKKSNSMKTDEIL